MSSEGKAREGTSKLRDPGSGRVSGWGDYQEKQLFQLSHLCSLNTCSAHGPGQADVGIQW